MDFVSGDNYHRSKLACSQLAQIVLAKLSGDSNFAWVERQQLDLTRRELDLTPLQPVDTTGVRLGRMLNADLLVTGRFTPSPQHDTGPALFYAVARCKPPFARFHPRKHHIWGSFA